ncbi:MAG: type II toxin-antitoxin system death-on-curing family toxin [Propioniciclava sp.]|uniref:type II toxin-antitoxin system death-on-curing family toxin n=1 Tax=Propioniciclava sp. TaxID=2038686 RepID=UPI0039E53917
MAQVDYLDLEDLLVVARALLGDSLEIRDIGLLESALARPRVTVFGEDAYRTIHEKAAALLDSVVNNHALVDGNKRLGWVAVRLFYGLNGWQLGGTENERVALVLAVADGSLQDVAVIAGRLERLITPR